MKLSLTAFIAAFLLIFTAPGFAQQKTKDPIQLEKPSDQVPHVIQTLTNEIRHQLITLPYYGVFDWLEFKVQPDGSVLLTGAVIRDSTKSDAEKRIQNLQGVRMVQNQIEVLPLTATDNQVRRAVYASVYKGDGPLFKYAVQSMPAIHIIVKDGHVTLKGIVENDMDKNLAFMAANGVPGVFGVQNDLVVQP